MRTVLVALLLAAPILAGCASPPGAGAPPEDAAPDPVAGRVLRYDAAGALLPNGTARLAAVQVATGFEATEPSIAALPSGALFVAAGVETLRSLDGGATWESVYTLAPPRHTGDPLVATDPSTNRVFANHMFPAATCTTFIVSEDEGETWTEQDAACGSPTLDFQKVAIGPPGPEENPLAGRLDPSVAYVCYHKALGRAPFCDASYDGGKTFPVSRPLVPSPCPGPTGFPAISAEGVVAIAFGQCAAATVATSRDSGNTWSFSSLPGDVGSGSADPRVAWSEDGALYAFWRAHDLTMQLARSDDGGATWAGPWRASPPGLESAIFQSLAAGPGGQVAMAFLGAWGVEGPSSQAPDDARYHLFIVTTEDALGDAPTFTSFQATPDEDPVQVGCITLGLGSPCRNLGDFLDATRAPDGTFLVAFTDGCAEGCAGKPSATADDSRSRVVTVARLEGWRFPPMGGT